MGFTRFKVSIFYELDELNLEFNLRRWNAIVDYVTVHHDGKLVFSFQNGSEVVVMV